MREIDDSTAGKDVHIEVGGTPEPAFDSEDGSSDLTANRSPDLGSVSIYRVGNDFLYPYWAPHARFVDNPEEADLMLALNDDTPGAPRRLLEARRYGKPLAWWTIEDPNSFGDYLAQARRADVVFTTDEACISDYRRSLGHNRVYWLPLAASPEYHVPAPLMASPTDFVISANWYENLARRWAVATVVTPMVRKGYSLSLFCYEAFMWPGGYRRFWRGQQGCRTVSEQYRHGRVVLGVNNQRSGLDGRRRTYMTSMRTFEALACGKPFLSAHSDAYERLGFVNGEHMVWVKRPEDALRWADRLLGETGERMAREGRAFVLSRHTYAHRLATIVERVLG